MTTTMLSTAIVVPEPVFSEAERVALAGFLAGLLGWGRSLRTKLVMIGSVMTMAPFKLLRSPSTSAGDLPPIHTGAATISPAVDADHPSA